MNITKEQLAGMIDHSLLKPQSTREELKNLCAEAVAHGFKACLLAVKAGASRIGASTSVAILSRLES